MDAMVQPLTCRGPDGGGTWITPMAGLGHRRLSVIDPEGGMQPMSRRYGQSVYTVVYNGELYNFLELRQELSALGYSFQTRSDTEVLLTGYIAWGPQAVERFNGIYAFAIWNTAERSLFLARDRMGVKPLFYSKRPHEFLFGSEPKAILAHPHIHAEVDAEGLAEIFAMGPARTPGFGVFHGIDELRPGHWLKISPSGCKLQSYWQLQSHEHPDNEEVTHRTIRALLEDTVKRQLIADVPVVTFLSGGLDSSIITALASQNFAVSGKPALETYSIEFTDMKKFFTPNGFQTNLDAPWAKKVSDYLHTHHHRIEFDTPDLIDSLQPALRARDFPGMADVDSSLLIFAEQIKKNATVALSGEAADEIFGGYPWFFRADALAASTFPWALRLPDRLAVLSPELRAWIQAENYVERRYQEALAEVPRLAKDSPQEARMREIGYLTMTRFLPTLLDRKDRMLMAVGLEGRVPYCDHRLVEYVWNIPWAMKASHGIAKNVLRQAVKDLLPEDVVMRQKSPYPSTPNPSYFAAMQQQFLDILA
ncbi:MAG: asparagine synthase (glutamine-hydrolyzing), partial [Firmicutes bacterium]|nr:asparagine synthase (glutamine-hydrolyzing) [Bacillota bacterium]